MPHFTPNGQRLRVCFNTPPRLSCTALPIQNNRSRQALCRIKSTYNLPSKFFLLEKLVYSQRQLSYKARAITDPIVSRDSYYTYDPRSRCSWTLDSFLQYNQHTSSIYRNNDFTTNNFCASKPTRFYKALGTTSAKSIKMRLSQDLSDVVMCGSLHDLHPASLDNLLNPQLLNIDMLHALAASEP